MMDISKQVITIEQAKRLKELGVGQDSICLWLDYTASPYGPKLCYSEAIHFETDRSYIYAAFTVAELGVMLPWDAESGRCADNSTEWVSAIDDVYAEAWHPTEAQARAALLIHLLESGKITPDEVNTRLQ